jgi:subtilase family serine protease
MSWFPSKRRTMSIPLPAAGDPHHGRRVGLRRRTGRPPALERLEPRSLLSGFEPYSIVFEPYAGTNTPNGYTPAQVRKAYGFDQVQFRRDGQTIAGDGAGQTIAIVTAFDHPTILEDLKTFDRQFGLPDPVFIKATPQGPPPAHARWALEAALDVEWAHAMAPAATILLVEARSNSYADVLGAVDYAASQAGVAVVSMSFGSWEFPGELTLDGHFEGHPGVAFVAAAGDSGAPPSYPAAAPGVLAVGGTTLSLGTDDAWSGETGWGGSGGGISAFEPKPPYQSGVPQSATLRTNPDVAYDADPSTGFAVYDSFPDSDGRAGWFQVGGTSAGAPQWSALIAIADQGRSLAGLGPLGSLADTPGKLYELQGTNFHDITDGNNGHAAEPGYDLVTGLGSPITGRVVAGLIGAPAPPAYLTGFENVNRTYYPLPSAASIAWADSPGGQSGFVIERSSDNGRTWSRIASVDANVRSYWDNTVRNGNVYYYRVRAFNSFGLSDPSMTLVMDFRLGGYYYDFYTGWGDY